MQGRRKVWKNGGPGGHSITIFCPFVTSYYLPLNDHLMKRVFFSFKINLVERLPPTPESNGPEMRKRERKTKRINMASSSLAPNWWPFQKGECVRPCWRASITFLATYYLYLLTHCCIRSGQNRSRSKILRGKWSLVLLTRGVSQR